MDILIIHLLLFNSKICSQWIYEVECLFMKLTLFGIRTNMVVNRLGYFIMSLNRQSLLIIKIWQQFCSKLLRSVNGLAWWCPIISVTLQSVN